jgi:hypothetical protein
MDPTQIAKIIADTASIELQEKFNKGQKEHGGDFAAKPTVRNIREEVLDLVNYSHMLTQHRSRILMELEQLSNDLMSLDSTIVRIRLANIKALVHDL